MAFQSAAAWSCDFHATRLHIFDGAAKQARHFARMRRDAKHSIRMFQFRSPTGERIQSIRIEDDRHGAIAEHASNELLRLGIRRESRADGERALPLQHSSEETTFKTARGNGARGGRGQRLGHDFRCVRGDDRKHRFRRRDGDQSRSCSQRRPGRKNCRAALAY